MCLQNLYKGFLRIAFLNGDGFTFANYISKLNTFFINASSKKNSGNFYKNFTME